MKKNEKILNKKEALDGIRQECRDCPEKWDCAFASKDIPGFTCGEKPEPSAHKESQDTDHEETPELGTDELRDLEESVNDLVDCLFTLVDKVVEAQRYLEKLDALADAALNYLSAIGVPQLDQED